MAKTGSLRGLRASAELGPTCGGSVFKRCVFLAVTCVLLAMAPAGAAYADFPGDVVPQVLSGHPVSNLLPGTGEVLANLSPEVGALVDGPNGLI